MPDIKAKSWTRFIATNFCVKPEIMGKSHEFVFENHNISVRIPKSEEADRDTGYDEIACLRSSLSETGEPLIYKIQKVDVEIDIPNKLSVPNEALNNSPTQYDYFSEEQSNTINIVCDSLSALAERAFDYWLSIIRWASENALIGQRIINDYSSGWSTYICDASTNHRVWGSTQVFIVRGERAITKEEWELSFKYLQNNDQIPMHIGFLHDAEASNQNGYHEKSILELAMACEVYLRYTVFKIVPRDIQKELVEYIEKANINQYASHFFKRLVIDSQLIQYKKLLKEINSLMDWRNNYVHMGIKRDSNKARCNRYITAIKALLKIELTN